MKIRFTIFLIAALTVSAPVVAQDYVPMYTPDFQGSMAMNTTIGNQLERDSRRGGSNASSTGRTASAGAAAGSAARASATSTSYRASSAVTERVKRQFAEFVGSQGGSVEGISQSLDSSDWIGAWADHVAVDGLKRGDVADAMTAYFVQNWQIANNVQSTSRTQVQAVRRQIAPIISGDPDFARLGDAEKQEMAEALMLNFIAQGTAFSDATQKNDTSMASRLSDAAVSRFRNEMGVDLRQLRLTDQGFVPGD